MSRQRAETLARIGLGGVPVGGLVMGWLPTGPLGGSGLEIGARVAQAAPILSSLWVWVGLIVAAFLLGALSVFLLWANDIPVPALAALRRAPAMVTPRTPEEHPPVHLPHPSYWPLVLGIAITLIAIGFLTHWIVVLIGVLATIGSIIGWALEPGE
ncbi:MAG: cytochrome c oxidase subunit 4 [Ardenticatenaceae bacterium]|nr:cytochrome c oxidase subunit 4 [Ardenticatenaceae bacterium]HBY96884.1 hypothetical protein [Chloroflexota bacterium]